MRNSFSATQNSRGSGKEKIKGAIILATTGKDHYPKIAGQRLLSAM
jgi:hypothetical protein